MTLQALALRMDATTERNLSQAAPSHQPLLAGNPCTAALLQAQRVWPWLQGLLYRCANGRMQQAQAMHSGRRPAGAVGAVGAAGATESTDPGQFVGPVGIAVSGGADSTALLYAAATLWPGQVQALHVHHGLQPAACAFLQQCQTHARALALPLHAEQLSLVHSSGASLEAIARTARYAVLAQMAQRLGLRGVLLAQHADDQAETLLLALSRGAGLAGLAAMPATFMRHGVHFGRPLLSLPGPSLRLWLQSAAIAWIEDPMNHDLHYTRSRIRHTLLPVLEQHFPAWRNTLARSASHAASALTVLREVAAADMALTGNPPSISALQALSPARAAWVLRHWLLSSHQAQASTAQLQALQTVINACRTRGHHIHLKVAAGFVLRRGNTLDYVADQAAQTFCD